jgi:hypothetical protein
MFTVTVSDNFDWDSPPLQFADRDAAVGHARSKIGSLVYMGAPGYVTVSVLRGKAIEVAYSVTSWRTAVKFIGDDAYSERH